MLLFLLTVGAILSIIGVALLAVCRIKYSYDAEALGKSLLTRACLHGGLFSFRSQVFRGRQLVSFYLVL